MSDTANILGYSECAKCSFDKKNYLEAAIFAYWCRVYCQQGEPYGMSSQQLNKYEREASKIYSNSLKKLSPIDLSKTMFVLGNQCEKALWLYRNRYKERKISQKTQAKFDRGHIIGNLAQFLFPDGTDASENPFSERVIDMSRFNLPFNLNQHIWINNTKSALAFEKPIYEAAFIHNGVFAAVDILTTLDSGYVAYEVKSSSEITDTYIWDSALQYYVINNCIELSDFVLVHLNESYINQLDNPLEDLNCNCCDVNQLFIKTSVLDEILPLQKEIETRVAKFKQVLNNGEPNIAIGEQCDNPYECSFKEYCNRKLRPLTFEDIW